MSAKDLVVTSEEALQNFLLDIGCLDELQPWTGHFNLFDVLKISRTEIRHSNMLSWLLNPNENHGMGDAFLKAVIQEVVVNDSKGRYDVFHTLLLDFYSFIVYREWRNIDILLISAEDQFLIVIENKIGSHEHDDQLKRYREVVEAEYPSYKKMYIYLTPDGDDPSDSDHWDVLSYTTVAEVLSKQKSQRELQPEVELMIDHYLDVIWRDIVEDQRLVEVCNKIYAKHKKALDLIFEHRTDTRAQLADSVRGALTELSEDNTIRFSKENSSDSRFVFYTHYMDQQLPAISNRASSWGTEYVYQYWIRLYEHRMCGIFELGGWNVPDKQMDVMQRIIGMFKPTDKRKENFKYKRIFRTKWHDVAYTEQVENSIAACTREIVEDLLNQEKELQRKLGAVDVGV